MAGVVAHIPPPLLGPWCSGAEAQFETEQEIPAPLPDSKGIVSLVIPMRSGTFGPLGVERIELLPGEFGCDAEAEAYWCDGSQRGASLSTFGMQNARTDLQWPSLSTRRATDELCVSFRAQPQP